MPGPDRLAVWTRGRNMPLAGLRERMMCPRCGNRRHLIFDPPSVAARASIVSLRWQIALPVRSAAL